MQQRKSVNGSANLALLGCLAAIGVLMWLDKVLKPIPVVPPSPPMYKVGECGKNSRDPDSDENHDDGTVFKIISVGKKNYELLNGHLKGKTFYVSLHKQSIVTLDPGTEKIECLKELNDPKALEKASNGQ